MYGGGSGEKGRNGGGEGEMKGEGGRKRGDGRHEGDCIRGEGAAPRRGEAMSGILREREGRGHERKFSERALRASGEPRGAERRVDFHLESL
jgi:hypothetical protein